MQHIYPDICFDCGAPAVERHHVVPRSLGGKNTVPLCVECHSKVHGGLGEERINHRSLTLRPLNIKQAAELAHLWWHFFKEGLYSDSDRTFKAIAEELGVDAGTAKKRMTRVKEMAPVDMKELFLPYIGYEWANANIWNLDIFMPTREEYLDMMKRRHAIGLSIVEELGLKPLEDGELLVK